MCHYAGSRYAECHFAEWRDALQLNHKKLCLFAIILLVNGHHIQQQLNFLHLKLTAVNYL